MAATYNAVNIQRTDLSVWLDVRRGLKETPDVRGSNTVVPGLVGQIPRNRVADRLEVELYGWIRGSSVANFWTLVKEIIALFDPEGGEHVLSIGLPDSTTATINARPLSVLAEGDVYGRAQHFSILLEAVNPPEWAFV